MIEVMPLRKYKYAFLMAFVIAIFIQIHCYFLIHSMLSVYQKITLILIQVFSMIGYAYCEMQNGEEQCQRKVLRHTHCVLLIIYLLNLVWILFFDESLGRNYETLSQYKMINLHIFATVRLFIHGYQIGTLTLERLLINFIGNLMLFMPMAYFLPFYFRSQRQGVIFLGTMIFIVLSVEVLQVVMKMGTGDVDDFLLNMIGVSIFYLILKRGHIERVYERLDN